jgi:hypothetical protein|tara:strand:- start:1236 stop:1406 length:171 start_codon:yes stop_codon:yes gene_type:complete
MNADRENNNKDNMKNGVGQCGCYILLKETMRKHYIKSDLTKHKKHTPRCLYVSSKA